MELKHQMRADLYYLIPIVFRVSALMFSSTIKATDTMLVGCNKLDNEAPGMDCWPLKWHPIMKHLEDAGVTWQVFQDNPNEHGQEILSGFEDFNTTQPKDSLYDKGLARSTSNSLLSFIARATNGTLPQVSWVISDEILSERYGYRPQDGAWLQLAMVAAVTTGNSANSSALFLSYDCKSPPLLDDEILMQKQLVAGGLTTCLPVIRRMERLENGCKTLLDMVTIRWRDLVNSLYIGLGLQTNRVLGFRVPFYIVSPWTMGGNVFTEHADHTSQGKAPVSIIVLVLTRQVMFLG